MADKHYHAGIRTAGTPACQCPFDTFTEGHFAKWLEATILDDEREQVEARMRAFVLEHPDLLERMGWPDIRTLSERVL